MGSALFETLFQYAGDAFFVADAETGALLDANRRAEDLTGYSRAELLSLHQADLHPAEMRDHYRHLFSLHAEEASRISTNVQVLKKGGGVTNVEIATSIHQVDGRKILFGIFRDTSDRDLLLKRLEQNERRNRTIAEFAPIALLVHCEGRIVFANHTAQTTLEVSDSLVGRNVIDFVHPDERPGVFERMARVLKSQDAIAPLEERLLKANGSVITAEVSATYVDWDGRPSVVAAFRDVSHQATMRQYRDALLQLLQNVLHRFETPALLQEVAEIFTNRFAASAVCITLRKGDSLSVQAATKVGVQLRDRLDGTLIAEDGSPCARTILFETPLLAENLSLMNFGGELASLFREARLKACWSMPVQDQTKKTIGAFTVYLGESRLPTDEEMSLLQHASYLTSVFIEKGELLDENYRLSLVARQTREGVVITDADRRVSWVNASFTRLTGYTLEEVRGRNLKPILQGPATSPTASSRMKEQLAAREGFQCRVFNYRKNGETFWNDLHIDPMHDRHGMLIGFIGLQTDVSEEVERQERLEQALARAEDASRTRSEFLSIVGHEVRTPLNSILGLTHLLANRDPRPDQQEDLRVLKEAASRLHSLLSNLLDYGRMEIGLPVLERAPFSIRELAGDLRDTFADQCASSGLALALEVDPAIPDMLIGDQTRLRQVLSNLLSNAVKFTAKGGVQLTFTLLGKEGETVDLDVVVTDTGEGIAPVALGRIFEPFFRADNSLTRKHSGTGLGLAIAEKILELLGSHIEVASQPGQGSTFRFRLRLDEAGEKAPAPVVHDLARLNGFRILIVEDYDANTLITRKFLELWNIQVDQARNGEEAVYKTRHGGYDLVLMDLHMPVMDGYEASRRIREFDTKLPIIALTASDSKDIPERIREAGMNDLITKPFHPADLNRKLRQFLKQP